MNGASFAQRQAVAPGSVVAIFGRRLSSARAEFREVPLPTQLSGTSVSIAGMNVPLFFTSDAQVDGQLPFGLPPSGRQQLVVKTGQGAGTPVLNAVPETITIVPAAPGIFIMDETGRGAIVNAVTGQVVTQNTPVRRGDYISIFGTGASARSMAQWLPAHFRLPRLPGRSIHLIVAIADLPAEVQFSGLAPGLVGLYQVNAIVPAEAPSGVQPLKLTIRGATSNSMGRASRRANRLLSATNVSKGLGKTNRTTDSWSEEKTQPIDSRPDMQSARLAKKVCLNFIRFVFNSRRPEKGQNS